MTGLVRVIPLVDVTGKDDLLPFLRVVRSFGLVVPVEQADTIDAHVVGRIGLMILEVFLD